MTTTHHDLRSFWLAEYNRPFSGWNFSHLEGRRVTIRPLTAWDYTSAVVAALEDAQSMLDMDTGGGEFMASLPFRPPVTCATEGYAPNVHVARQRLEPFGVEVFDVAGHEPLPFAHDQFDVITNRHGAYDPHEVGRILKPGGLFITQQVGSQANRRLHELLEHTPQRRATNQGEARRGEWNLAIAVTELEAAGFRIAEQREEFPITRYFDVGAIVYYLKAIPWEIPDFSVDTYFPKLVAIHAHIQAEGYVDILFHQSFIRALKTPTGEAAC